MSLAPSDSTALARLYGEPLFALPPDLYIPPDALAVFLDAFEGPLDLLLYLIRAQNLDILGLGGDELQTHRCGFEPEELASLGYHVIERPYTLSRTRRHTTAVAPETITQLNAIKRF